MVIFRRVAYALLTVFGISMTVVVFWPEIVGPMKPTEAVQRAIDLAYLAAATSREHAAAADQVRGKAIAAASKANRRETGYGTLEGIMASGDTWRFSGSLQDAALGLGVWTFGHGEKYEGNWVNGEFVGPGVFSSTAGDLARGDFVDGKLSGWATYKFPNGLYYEGEFKNGLRNGSGVLTWPDGSFYKGEWRADARNGVGAMFDANGHLSEQGIYKDDALDQ